MKRFETNGSKLSIRDMAFEVHAKDPRYVLLSTNYGGTLAHSQSGVSRVFTVVEARDLRDWLNTVLPMEELMRELT